MAAVGGAPAEGDPVPPEVRMRLRLLFSQIEAEIEAAYSERGQLAAQLNVMTDKLMQMPELKSRDLLRALQVAEKKSPQPQKKSSSQISEKILNRISTLKHVNNHSRFVKSYRGATDGVWDVSVRSYNGTSVLATASADHKCRLYLRGDTRPGAELLGHNGSVNSVRLHQTWPLALTASGDGSIQIHNFEHCLNSSQQQAGSSDDNVDGSEDDLDATPQLANSLPNSSSQHGLGQFHRYRHISESYYPPETVVTCQSVIRYHTLAVAAADWLSSSQIISGSWDRLAAVFDVETGKEVHRLSGHEQELTNVTASSSAPLALTSSRDCTFRLWDCRDRVREAVLCQGHSASISTAIFASSEMVISGGDDRTVKVWDLRHMAVPQLLYKTPAAVNRLAVTSNLIAAPLDNRHVHIFDFNGAKLGRLPHNSRQGHTRMVTSCCFSDTPSTSSSSTAEPNLFTVGFDAQTLAWQISNSS